MLEYINDARSRERKTKKEKYHTECLFCCMRSFG